MIVDNKLEMKEKEAFVTYLKEIFRHLPGVTEEKCTNLRLFLVMDEIRAV
jgi:hypothetical protein